MNLAIGLVGVLLMLVPFGFRITDQATVLWTSIVLGALVVLAMGYKAMAKDHASWEYLVAGLVGAGAIIAPFILGFSALPSVMWAMVVLGGLLVLLDGYEVVGGHEASS